MPAKPLTPEQLEDAARLDAFFKEWQRMRKQRGEKSSQMDAAQELGFNQSALSQYLKGNIPLNLSALTKFAELLDRKPEEISPALASKFVAMASQADYLMYDSSGNLLTVDEAKAHTALPITAKNSETEDVVNTSSPNREQRVNNEHLRVARQFSDELMSAVNEGRVSIDLLETLTKILRMGLSSMPRGDQHHTKMVRSRGIRRRGTGTQ